MSNGQDCCTPCPSVQNTNIPGPEGPQGDAQDGQDGINAFTQTAADFIVPAIGAQVTIVVVETRWMVVGEPIFIEDAGIFEVVSIGSQTSVTLEYLDYDINTHSTETISTGAGVTPSGNQPNSTLLPEISEYATGGSQALTSTPSQLLSLNVILPSVKKYLLLAQVRLDFLVATFEANRTGTIKLRRTNNTPGDLSNALQEFETPITVAETSTFKIFALPPVVYLASAGDEIQLFGSVEAAPYSGSLSAISGSILAIPLF